MRSAVHASKSAAIPKGRNLNCLPWRWDVHPRCTRTMTEASSYTLQWPLTDAARMVFHFWDKAMADKRSANVSRTQRSTTSSQHVLEAVLPVHAGHMRTTRALDQGLPEGARTITTLNLCRPQTRQRRKKDRRPPNCRQLWRDAAPIVPATTARGAPLVGSLRVVPHEHVKMSAKS